MMEPLRIIDGDDERARSLLRAESGEAPPEGAERRLLAALGVGAAAALAGGATLGGASSKTTLALVSKWFLVGLVVAAGAVGAFSFTRGKRPAPVGVAPPLTTVRADAIEPTPAPARTGISPEDLPVAPPPKARAARATDEAETLQAEIAFLDAARAALVEGHPRRTLEMLNEYPSKFPSPRLEPEAFLLRLDATVRSGDTAEARRLANEYLAVHPNTPHAARITRIVGP
jgi:hypothetical protein